MSGHVSIGRLFLFRIGRHIVEMEEGVYQEDVGSTIQYSLSRSESE